MDLQVDTFSAKKTRLEKVKTATATWHKESFEI
jgi:hypothetical protein